VNYSDKAREIVGLEIEGLRAVQGLLGKSFDAAIRMILDCLAENRKVVVTGVGKNLHIAQKISATLASTGTTSVVLNPSQAMHGDLGILNDGDVLLSLSYSGESEELVNLVPLVRRAGVRIVTITGDAESTLARHGDITIAATVPREACPFNMAPTASTTAALAVGDALAMVLLKARGLNRDDYAKLHPGGAIGRSLLLRVADIMRTEDRLATVPAEGTVKDAVVAMTRARTGSTGVVDGEGRLIGVFTDGDLRRHISEDPHILSRPVADVMTPSPITVCADQLAVDVLRVFEQHHVDDLLVVDENGVLVGEIDGQDLPKLKIV
jgi:arabinose-5-phosphate isomerase